MPPRASASSSDSDDDASSRAKHTHMRRSLHELFGGGKVADVLLWKDKKISAGVLAAGTAIWSIFEVMEYNFLTLLCHLAMLILGILFLWSVLAALFDRDPPKIPEVILSEQAFREVALAFHKKLTRFVSKLHDIGSGKNLRLFFATMASLWILSILGNSCDSMSLIYACFLCLHSLPVFYEHYHAEVDGLAHKGNRQVKKLYRRFDSKVLDKIPRGPVKDKKHKK
ncbi:unnamed protein product [Victoria cruziana]